MEQEEKNTILLTQDENGNISEKKITLEELGQVFFSDGNREWDQIQRSLPKPVWKKLYDRKGNLAYEGYTLSHKAFGAGRAFSPDGSVSMEGFFGIKGLLFGRRYYDNGIIQFEGIFHLNQAWGPNYPEYGVWYDRNGKMLYHGKFAVSRSSLGWPSVEKPEGFGPIPDHGVLKEIIFMWDDARKLMKNGGDHDETDES